MNKASILILLLALSACKKDEKATHVNEPSSQPKINSQYKTSQHDINSIMKYLSYGKCNNVTVISRSEKEKNGRGYTASYADAYYSYIYFVIGQDKFNATHVKNGESPDEKDDSFCLERKNEVGKLLSHKTILDELAYEGHASITKFKIHAYNLYRSEKSSYIVNLYEIETRNKTLFIKTSYNDNGEFQILKSEVK